MVNKTFQEIRGQYEALQKSLDYLKEEMPRIREVINSKAYSRIIFLGCGSSYNVAQSMAQISKTVLRVNAEAYPAGDLLLHISRYLSFIENALIVTISRSGNTTEIVLAVEAIKKSTNNVVLSITCAPKNQLSKLSDISLDMPWAFDESVCQTRTVTCFYGIGLALIALLGDRGDMLSAIQRAMEKGPEMLQTYEKKLEEVARFPWKDVAVLADAELEGIAGEGALAFKEICQLPSNYYHVLDCRHGPMVMIKPQTLVIIALSDGNTYETGLINDLYRKKCTIVAYSDFNINLPEKVLQVNSEEKLPHAVRGIPFILICQLLAYYKALINGIDPDNPDGLDPWIKL